MRSRPLSLQHIEQSIGSVEVAATGRLGIKLVVSLSEGMSLSLKKIAVQNIRYSDRELIQMWLRQKAVSQRREKRRLVKQFLAFVEKPLTQVTGADLQSFVTFLLARRTNPHQVLKVLAAVKSLLLFGYSIGMLNVNITEDEWPQLQVKQIWSRPHFFLAIAASIVSVLLGMSFAFILPKLTAQKAGQDYLILDNYLELDPEIKANLANFQIKAFLDTIAWAEGTLGPDGYQLQFTGVKFYSFADHPRKVICSSSYGQRRCSNAAGRYQFLDTTWDEVAQQLNAQQINIVDFSPLAQDVVAIELIKIEDALEDIKAGRFELAIKKVANRWASLPGNTYGQPKKSMSELRNFYQKQLERYQTYPLPQQQI